MIPSQLATGSCLDLDVVGLISDGRGLARHDGLAVFIANALPGQRVRARLTAVKPRLAEAVSEMVLADAPDARPPACCHFLDCGGCTWQTMPYAAQLHWKQRFVRDALQRIGNIAAPPVSAPVAAPREWRYRNKMEFAFAQTPAGPQVGLFRRNSHEIVPVTHCLLQQTRTMDILGVVRERVRGMGVSAWDRQSRTGFWRFLVIREPEAGGCVVEAVTAPDRRAAEHGARLAEALEAAIPGLTGFVLSERRALTDVAYGERIILTRGEPGLEECVNGVRLRLGTGAFFQVNTPGAGLLFEAAARMAAQGPVSRVWDVYCGVGSISLYLARTLDITSLVGLESSGTAVAQARTNAARLVPRTRSTWLEGDAARLLPGLLGKASARPDLLIVDPPRAGLDKPVVQALTQAGPEQLMYVSCEPSTLARDVSRLNGYCLRETVPVDLFPQTPHVETVSLLLRR